MSTAASSPETERQLAMDRRIFGACYWRELNGEKVRIDPRVVTVTPSGKLIDDHRLEVQEQLFAEKTSGDPS